MSADKILGDKMPVKIARGGGGGGQNAGHFKGQGGPILSKHLIYDIDCQVN